MRHLLILLTIPLLFSCNGESESIEIQYLNKSWFDGENIVLEGGLWHVPTRTVENSNGDGWITRFILQGDTIVPFEVLDSVIILSYSEESIDSTEDLSKVLRDTLLYEFRYFDGPKLILKTPFWYLNVYEPEYQVLTLGDDQSIDEFVEIRNFDTIDFEIQGLSVGDTIDRAEFIFSDIVNHSYPFEYTSEEATWIEDPDITVEVCAKRFITHIERKHIPSRHIQDIVDVVSHKLQDSPSHTKRDVQSKTSESYFWYKDGITISLREKRHFPNTLGKLWGLPEDGWVLSYENDIYTLLVNSILQDNSPQSLIIE